MVEASKKKKSHDEMYCSSCGAVIKKDAEICPKCGVRQKHKGNDIEKPAGRRKFLVALLLSIFLGSIGIDRFYMGLIGTGILKLLTLGGCGIWYIIDVILIATNSLKDADGKYLQS
ncbi:TM2 domain-containing protein [Candidatus Woesearchaeota archaeon]|nr:TM2 domain-containing protein [Candidatus Woesearchaeota archaeon]